MKKIRDTVSLVRAALDDHLDSYQDASYELASEEYQRASCLWEYVQEGQYPNQKDADELVGILAYYITRGSKCQSEADLPNYEDAENQVAEAKDLLEFIGNVQGNHEALISKCTEDLRKFQKLDFPFDFQAHFRKWSFVKGEAVELPVLTSLEVILAPEGSGSHDESVFVRIGQKEPETRLYEIELTPPFNQEFVASLYEVDHAQNKRTALLDFQDNDFWICRDPSYEKATTPPNQLESMGKKDGIHFSVYFDGWIVGFAKLTIGNVGSNLGVFVQRSKKPGHGET